MRRFKVKKIDKNKKINIILILIIVILLAILICGKFSESKTDESQNIPSEIVKNPEDSETNTDNIKNPEDSELNTNNNQNNNINNENNNIDNQKFILSNQDVVNNQEKSIGEVKILWDVEKSEISHKEICKIIPGAYIVGASGFGASDTLEIYKEMNLSFSSLLLSNNVVRRYIREEIDSLSDIKHNSENIYRIYCSDIDMTIITVLNENYHLIAYCVVPPKYQNNLLTFTLCDFAGKKEIEQIKEKIKNEVENAIKLDSNTMYIEYNKKDSIETGTLKIKENYLTDKTKDIKYFYVSENKKETELKNILTETNVDILKNSEHFSSFVNLEEILVLDKLLIDKGIITFYNEDKELVAYTVINEYLETKEIEKTES